MLYFNAVAYLIKDLAAVFSLILINQLIFGRKSKPKPVFVILFLVAFCINAFGGGCYLMRFYADTLAVMDGISLALYFAAIYLFFERRKSIGKTIWEVLLYICTTDMLYGIFSVYLPEQLFVECIFNCLIFSLMTVIIYSLSKKSQIQFLPHIFKTIPKWILFAVILFDLSRYYKEFGLSDSWYNVIYIISTVFILLCIGYFFTRIFKLSYEQNTVIDQMTTQKEYAENMIKSNEELRDFRHDYKNQMLVVNAFLENGDINEAKKYIDTMNGQVLSSLAKIRTGNFISDAIINNKAIIAKSNGIHINFDGQIPSNGIENYDLSTILSNILDNAIEATVEYGNHGDINIESIVKNSFLILTVSNYTVINSEIKGKRLKTTKQDKTHHGIGLRNINKVVEKYKGTMTLTCENHIFTVNVRLKIN